MVGGAVKRNRYTVLLAVVLHLDDYVVVDDLRDRDVAQLGVVLALPVVAADQLHQRVALAPEARMFRKLADM